jgi:hypothetical protein
MRRPSRRRLRGSRPHITAAQILAWADAHHRRTGRWPMMASGPVTAGPLGLIWRALDSALRLGFRGLPGGSSLARLLAEHRHVRNLCSFHRRRSRMTSPASRAWGRSV